jgi:hypothetical protein
MKIIKAIVVVILFTYGGFMTGYFAGQSNSQTPPAGTMELSCPCKPQGAKVQPLVDWQKFYYAAKMKDVRIRIGVYIDPLAWGERLPINGGVRVPSDEYKLYIEDGKKQHLVAQRLIWPHLIRHTDIASRVRYANIAISEMKEDLPGVPSKDAKFVVVGEANPKIYELSLFYGKEDN